MGDGERAPWLTLQRTLSSSASRCERNRGTTVSLATCKQFVTVAAHLCTYLAVLCPPRKFCPLFQRLSQLWEGQGAGDFNPGTKGQVGRIKEGLIPPLGLKSLAAHPNKEASGFGGSTVLIFKPRSISTFMYSALCSLSAVGK